jgi:hypothetical protein
LEQIKAVAKKDPNITQQDMNNFQTIIASWIFWWSNSNVVVE